MSPGVGIALVLGALGALLPAVKWLQIRGALSAESSRKAVHLGMGTLCLSFPWLFTQPWPVWILAGAAGLVLASVRFIPTLRTGIGSVLHGVPRTSLGELCFPVAVALVFTLAEGDPLLFLIPIGLLTFADAAGAVIGTRWGRHRYATLEGVKSIEGSAAVGLTGMLVSTVPLLIGGYGWVAALLIGMAIGLFALNLEAISSHGLDNIFLPLAAYAQCVVHFDTPLPALAANLSVLFMLTVLAIIWRRGQIIDESARLGTALALYFFWTVGGPEWLLAPLLFLASYVWLMPGLARGAPLHTLVAVICVSSASLLWGIAEAYRPDERWFALYTLGIATHQAMITAVRFSQRYPQWSRLAWFGVGVTQAVVVQGAAHAFLGGFNSANLVAVALGAVCVSVATAGFVWTEPKLQNPANLANRWWRQGLTALLASGGGLLLFKL